MPRGPSSGKRQQGAANQRDTRHENGPVAPGKRVQKQKSNGHLNGHAKASESTSSTPPLPGTPPATNGHARQSFPGDTSIAKMEGGALRRTSVNVNEDISGAETNHHSIPGTPILENHRQIDVSDVKNPSVHRDPINYMLTVLQSCPLRDTLAILIFLLQIPPTSLSVVHFLFAALTFVPPSSATTSSGLSFTDMLQGTLGTASIGTIFAIDLVVLLVWLLLWSPFQDWILDLAQTVIALTLGGGTSGKESGAWNILCCVCVLVGSTLAKNANIKQYGFRAMLESRFGNPDPDDPLERPSGSKRHTFVHTVLAIHILTQGIVRTVRDWYVRREKRDSASIGDPEAGKNTSDSSDSALTTSVADTEILTSHASSGATGKRKKKNSQQVRSSQPLWAALASTKIVMVKEYETSHTAAESAGANATDLNNLGNAPFNTEPDRIWITHVGSVEVSFNTSYFPVHDPAKAIKRDDGADVTKPFYVRVNNAIWALTRIEEVEDSASRTGHGIRWNGEIPGLAPTTNYECTFHSSQDDSIIFTTSIRTLQSLDSDPLISPSAQVTGRPGSPSTILKTAISTAESRLSEEQHRLNSQKKNNQNALSKLRKDINRIKNQIASVGGEDERNRQKTLQSQMSIKHNEDATVALEARIKSLEAESADLARVYAKAKSKIQSERDQHAKLLGELNTYKQDAERALNSMKSEVATLQQKCDGKKARISQLVSKHENLTDANAKGLNEVQHREAVRQKEMTEHERRLVYYDGRVQLKLNELNDGKRAIAALDMAIHKLQESLQERAAQNESNGYMQSSNVSNHNLAYGSETINENVPTHYASPWNPAPSTSGMNTFYTSAYPPLLSHAVPTSSPQGSRTRQRSSSMLSTASRFTQSDDDETERGAGAGNGLIWEDAREDRKSSGSGSGSGSGNGSKSGSVCDPRSPASTTSKLSKC